MAKRGTATVAVLAAVAAGFCLAGCSQADAVKAASMIHAYLPTAMALAQDAAAMTAALDPSDAGAVQAVNAKVQTDLQVVESTSGAYATAPSGSGWAGLEAAVDTLVADTDQGLLTALAIKNPESRTRARAALSALDAAVHVLDGYLLTARTPAEAQTAAAQRTVKLQSVARYWDRQDWRRVEEAFALPGGQLAAWETSRGF